MGAISGLLGYLPVAAAY